MRIENTSFVLSCAEFLCLLVQMRMNKFMLDDLGSIDALDISAVLKLLAQKKLVLIEGERALIDRTLHRTLEAVAEYRWEAELSLPKRNIYLYVGQTLAASTERRNGQLLLTPHPDVPAFVRGLLDEIGALRAVRVRFSDGIVLFKGDIEPGRLMTLFEPGGRADYHRSKSALRRDDVFS